MTLSEQLKTVSPELAKRTGDFAADKIDVEISALVAKADNAGNHTAPLKPINTTLHIEKKGEQFIAFDRDPNEQDLPMDDEN